MVCDDDSCLLDRSISLTSKGNPAKTGIEHIFVSKLLLLLLVFSFTFLFLSFSSFLLLPRSICPPSPSKQGWFPVVFSQSREDLPLDSPVRFEITSVPHWFFFNLCLPDLPFNAGYKIIISTGNEWYHLLMLTGCGTHSPFSSTLSVWQLVLLIIILKYTLQKYLTWNQGPTFKLELLKNERTLENIS